MKKKIIGISIVICILIALGTACSPNAVQQAAQPSVQPTQEQALTQAVQPTQAPPVQESQPAQQTEAPLPSTSPERAGMAGRETKITKDDAIKAVQAAYPDYTVGKVELDAENNMLYWEVEIFDKYNKDHDVYVDAETGVVVNQKGAAQANTATPSITQEQAEKAVKDKYPGCTITEIDYDDERGYFFWKVEVFTKDRMEQDVYVDAYNGTVMNKMEYESFKLKNGLDD